LRAIAGRYDAEIPRQQVHAFTARSIFDDLRHRATRAPGANPYDSFLHVGQAFGARVAAHLRRQRLDPERLAFFGYNTGCLETLDLLNRAGVTSVVDQIDPGRVEEDLVIEERKRWPGWEPDSQPVPQAYWDRLQAEWHSATRVLVNSEWSRDALVRQGVPESKLIVVPLAYEASSPSERVPRARSQRLQVLWVGSVNLRKGIQYLIEAARQLHQNNVPVDLTVAGPVMISERAVKIAPPNVTFLGRVTRERTEELYRQADVFVLPTVSDGFAIVQLEAMAQGLPVITTPNCARVVENGRNGLLMPAGDGAALADALTRMSENRELVAEMGLCATETARGYSLDALARNLTRILAPS